MRAGRASRNGWVFIGFAGGAAVGMLPGMPVVGGRDGKGGKGGSLSGLGRPRGLVPCGCV